MPMAQEEIMHVPMVVNHRRHHHVEQGGNYPCAQDVVFVVIVVLVVRIVLVVLFARVVFVVVVLVVLVVCGCLPLMV